MANCVLFDNCPIGMNVVDIVAAANYVLSYGSPLLLTFVNEDGENIPIDYNCEEECGAELADVTGDGQINVLDLVQISYYVLELSTPAYPCAADYNQDGQVNILDLVQISNYILYP